MRVPSNWDRGMAAGFPEIRSDTSYVAHKDKGWRELRSAPRERGACHHPTKREVEAEDNGPRRSVPARQATATSRSEPGWEPKTSVKVHKGENRVAKIHPRTLGNQNSSSEI